MIEYAWAGDPGVKYRRGAFKKSVSLVFCISSPPPLHRQNRVDSTILVFCKWQVVNGKDKCTPLVLSPCVKYQEGILKIHNFKYSVVPPLPAVWAII